MNIQVTSSAWFERTFDRAWLDVYAHRNDHEAVERTPHIQSLLSLRAGQSVLDVGCGAGRYARAFAARGFRVTGIDLSRDMIEEARRQSPLLPGAPSYMVCDARRLPFYGQFDAAISMFTSFGYFDARADDRAMLSGIHRALRTGGRLLLDYLNTPQVRASLVATSHEVTPTSETWIERHIDETFHDGPVVRKSVRVVDRATGRDAVHFEERVRLYTRGELDRLLTDAGFSLVGEPLGDTDGRAWNEQAPRFVRVAMRTS